MFSKIKMLDKEIKGKQLGESTCNIFNRSLVEFMWNWISIDQIRKPSRQKRLAMMRLSNSQECRCRWPLTDDGATSSFLFHSGVKAIHIQWKPYFGFWSFLGLVIQPCCNAGQRLLVSHVIMRVNSQHSYNLRVPTNHSERISLSGQCSINCTRYSTLL